MSRQSATLLVLLSALGFGSIALFARMAYGTGVSPTMLLAWRFLLAVAILAPVVWLRRLPLPRGRVLAGFALMGLLCTLQAQSYFTALMYASSGLVGLLLYIYPVLVTLLALAFGWERLDRRMCMLLTTAIVGLAIMLGGNLQGRPLGIALGILAAVVYSVYITLGGRLTRNTDPLAATLVVMTTAAFGNGVLAIAGGMPLPSGATAWLAIGVIALFSTVMAIGAFLIGIKYVGAARASIISTLEPVVTICFGIIFLGESVSINQLVGGVMVLAAVTLLAQRPAATSEAAAAGLMRGSETACPDL